MNWRSVDYHWAIAVVVMPIALLLLKHWIDSRKKAVSQSAIPARKTEGFPNIQLTGVRTSAAGIIFGGVWMETIVGESSALILQFTNEPRRGSGNADAWAKALMVFSNEREELSRITGCWTEQHGESVCFRVGDTHMLIVGLIRLTEFKVLAKHRRPSLIGKDVLTAELETLPYSFARGSVRVVLTNLDTGDGLYDGQFLITVNPLTIVSAGT